MFYKLGCNWGAGKPSFYALLRNHSIVICRDQPMEKGDFVAIAEGFYIVALAQIISDRYPCTSKSELENDFGGYYIDFEDWNYVADAKIWEIPQSERFQFETQKGICRINKKEIQNKLCSLMNKIMGNEIIDKSKKLLQSNYNIILTGAPGTGKTYLAKEIAKAMGAKYKLVQFHPSYDYTDFVEGLRPIKNGDTLGFERKDGVFKEFCKMANKDFNAGPITEEMIKGQFHDLWKKINDGEIKSLPLSSGKDSRSMIVDQNTETIHFSSKDNPIEISEGNDVTVNDIIKIIISNKINTINKIEEIGADRNKLGVGGNSSNKWAVCKYILEKIQNKSTNQTQPYVFIIDEINRGEISKIFGELFYSIDAGYRGEKGKVDTQYQNLIAKEGDFNFDPNDPDVFRNGFFIPENVYIIGTMNDIDRSVESMDFAMRRRFAWKEITVESRQSMLDDDEAWGGNKPAQNIIDEIKIRMNNLNACIIDQYFDEEISPKDKIGLTKAYQIGASYFLKYGMYGNFEELWVNHLEGLLYEYLRGTSYIEVKINRLKNAYNNSN